MQLVSGSCQDEATSFKRLAQPSVDCSQPWHVKLQTNISNAMVDNAKKKLNTIHRDISSESAYITPNFNGVTLFI